MKQRAYNQICNGLQHSTKFLLLLKIYCMNFFMAIFFLLISFSISAQDSTRSIAKTKIEGLTSKSGFIVQQESEYIGTVLNIKFKAMKLTDIKSAVSVKGVYLSLENTYSGSISYSVFIDEDELNDIFYTLEYLTTDKFKYSEQASDVQVTYTSRGYFQIGCFSDNEKWKFFIKLDKFARGSQVLLANDTNFKEVLLLFKNSKNAMDKL